MGYCFSRSLMVSCLESFTPRSSSFVSSSFLITAIAMTIGPVVRPMVMAIAVIRKEDETKLLDLGVKDSKQLTIKEREKQYPILKELLVEYKTIHIQPDEI